MSDDTERVYELSDDLSRDARAFQDAATGPLPGSARDDSAAIELELGDDGALAVTIAEGWRSAYEPSALAGAVLQTYRSLIASRTADWATHAESALAEERRNVPIPPLGDTTAGKLQEALAADPEGAAAAERVLENLLEMLDDVTANFDASFDEALRRGRAAHRSEPETRHLSVEVNLAGDLLSLTFSEEWLGRAAGSQISRELTDAIAQARAEASADGSGPLDGTPLAKYQRFANDPDAFVRFVRGEE